MICYPLRSQIANRNLKIGGCQCPETGWPVTAFLNERTGEIRIQLDAAPDGYVDTENLQTETQRWCKNGAKVVKSDQEACEHLLELGFDSSEIEIWPED